MCVSVLWFAQACVMVALPTLVAGMMAARRQPAAQQAEQQARRPHVLARVARAAAAAWASADAGLVVLAHGDSIGSLQLALSAHGLLIVLWLLAKAAALQPLGPA